MRISCATFDISKDRTGWSVGVINGEVDGPFRPGWGTISPLIGQHKEIETMGRFGELLAYLHGKYDLTNIVWESIFVDAARFQFFGSQAQCNMEGVLMEFCHANEIHGSHVSVSEWRAAVYGSARCPPHHRGKDGKAEKGYWKQQAVDWAASCNYSPINFHDEAESLAILHWALSKLDANFAARTGPLFRRTATQTDNAMRESKS